MSLVDRVQYAFNSVMSLKTEVAANQENSVAAIHDLSMELEKVKREICTLTKLVREVKNMAVNEIEYEMSFKSFIDNEAEEASEEDSQPDVIFVGETRTSNKKRRLE